MKSIVISLLVVVMTPIFCLGQQSDLGNWALFFGNKKINEKLNWHHEIQYRNYNAIGDLEQLLIRTGLGLKIKDNSNILLGYGFIRSENYFNETDKIHFNEHRIFQQFITKQSLGKLRFQHRYRFEQRFVVEDFKLRFRYFLGLQYPIWNKPSSQKELYISFYDEIFLNTKRDVFDRNRTYGGLGFKLSETLKFELGYMNQFLNGGNRDQINMVCFYNW